MMLLILAIIVVVSEFGPFPLQEKPATSIVKEENQEDDDLDDYFFPDCGDEEED